MQKFMLFLLVVGVVLAIGLMFFVRLASTCCPQNQELDTEAIVVLTGGSGRIEAGLELLAKNHTKRLFITGVESKKEKIMSGLEVFKSLPVELQTSIELGQEATSTVENALEAKAWLDSRSIQSITLVTSAYHMPRSLLEFKDAMPDRRIECYSVFSNGFTINEWWKDPKSRMIFLKEYAKYLAVITKIYTRKFSEIFTRNS
jgi:uncharacterized SAM-binding protein YcdF (DUF218 family)